MGIVHATTNIATPIEACFDAARDMDLHCRSTAHTGERVVAGRHSGLLELNEEVTFEAVHFGVRQRLTSRLTECVPPHRFVDEMQRGAFKSMRHVHEFEAVDGGTRMIDTLEWVAPLGVLGRLADALFLKRYMRRFLESRNVFLKDALERGNL